MLHKDWHILRTKGIKFQCYVLYTKWIERIVPVEFITQDPCIEARQTLGNRAWPAFLKAALAVPAPEFSSPHRWHSE